MSTSLSAAQVAMREYRVATRQRAVMRASQLTTMRAETALDAVIDESRAVAEAAAAWTDAARRLERAAARVDALFDEGEQH